MNLTCWATIKKETPSHHRMKLFGKLLENLQRGNTNVNFCKYMDFTQNFFRVVVFFPLNRNC